MKDFNESRDYYRESINETISVAGVDHEYVMATKGRMINDLIARHFSSSARVRVLDVGCGHGYVHPPLIAAGHKVTGVEIAADVLELARKAQPEAEYRSYDGDVLPFPDGSFDVAIAMCVVHHVPVPKWADFIREIRRAVRPGGLILIFEHNPLNPFTRYVVATSPLDVGVTMVRRRLLERLFRDAGCDSVHSDYIFFTPFVHPFFRWLDRQLRWLPIGARYFTLAQR